jgi:hypothetical protein
MVVLSRLGSFFNLRGGNFPSQLRALLSGEEAWELSYPVQGWPQPVQGEFDDPGWSSLEDLVRARALQFLEQAGLSLWSDEKLVNNLSQRVFTVFCNLASDGQSPPHSELTARLQEPPPSPHFPRAGEGYLRLLEAARWALEPWRKGDEKLALALAHHLLGLF